MQPDNASDKLVWDDRGKPNVTQLIEEFGRCTPITSGWHRLATNESTRFCRWEGQDSDGRKHDYNQLEGSKAFPFDGASDARTFAIDEAIEEIVSVEFVSFFRAILRVQGIEAGDLAAASYVNKLLEWVVGTKQFHQLRREVELHSQYTHTYGWSILHVCWLQEHVLKLVETTLEQVLAMAQQAAQAAVQDPGNPQLEITQALPALILDPTRENEFVSVITNLMPALTAKRARAMVRDLRDTGRAEVPMPALVRDEPLIRALKPWEEVFIANSATDIQQARVFVKEWLTEVQLRSMIYTDGWNADWVEAAAKLRGQVSSFGAPASLGGDGTAADTLRLAGEAWTFSTYDVDSDLIEVVHAYTRRLDEDNVPGIWRTTFHASLTRNPADSKEDFCAKHELLDYRHGKMPFVVRKREEWARTITSSRGLPEILYTTQRSGKTQEDGIVDSTSLSVMPPIIVPELMGVDYQFRPGGQIPEMAPGRAPRAMQFATPGVPVAFELMDRLQIRIDHRIGKRLGKESPEGADAIRQRLVQCNLVSWSEAFQQEFQLLAQFMAPEEFQRVTGAPEGMQTSAEAIQRQYDFHLTFDVRELSMDYVIEELKAIKDVILPVDATGRIDRGKLVELLLRAINPTLAKELIMAPESASQAVFQQVRTDLIGMMGGFPANYVELDPTAGAQIQYAKQFLQQNPKMQAMLQQDPHFQKLFADWEQNRMQSVVQEQNKVVGRIGVNPNGPQP